MRAHRLITGLVLVAVLAAVTPALAATSNEEATRSLLLNTELRLKTRLENRGLRCEVGMQDPPFGCGVLTRLHIRIVRILEELGFSVSSSSSSRSSSSVSSSSSSRTSSSSSSSVSYDPLADTQLSTSTMVLFGQTTPIAASVQAYINEEPLHVTDVSITVSGSKQAIDAFLVYDDRRRLLGRASKNGSDFVLHLQSGELVIPRRETKSLYVRAQTGSFDRNREGAGDFTVLTVTLDGFGEWSNDEYSKPLTSTFPTIQPVAGLFRDLRNGMTSYDLLQEGTRRQIFDLQAFSQLADSAADVRITDLTFRIISSGVTLSDPYVTVVGSGITSDCTLGSSTITCASLPATLGTVRDNYSLELYADVDVDDSVSTPQLQIVLQNPGDPGSSGDITWTDGFSTFTWVPGNTPVVRGTYFTR